MARRVRGVLVMFEDGGGEGAAAAAAAVVAERAERRERREIGMCILSLLGRGSIRRK